MCKLFVVPRCELGMLKTEKASDRCEVYYMKETISDRLVFPKTKQKETNQKTKNRTMRIVGSPMRFVFLVLFFLCFVVFVCFFHCFLCFQMAVSPYVSDKRLRISMFLVDLNKKAKVRPPFLQIYCFNFRMHVCSKYQTCHFSLNSTVFLNMFYLSIRTQ